MKNEWVVYEGNEGPGKGKHIVLVSGDEEYRSNEKRRYRCWERC